MLIDGNAILHRAYHAIPKTLTSRLGEPINAVYGFTSILLRLITDIEPTHIAICFDRSEPTFRHTAFEKYQSHRPSMDEDLSVQFEIARKVAQAFGIPVFDKAGYEADDLIGTIAEKSKKEIDSVVIVTGDRDILQLVDDKVSVYLPTKGISEGKLMGVTDVVEKMGVAPSQVADLKALTGDSSDNYPGVPGIGPKTAIELLKNYSGFDDVYNNIDNINPKVADKLKQGEDSGKMSYHLAQIIKNTPIDIDIDDMRKWNLGKPEIITLFTEIGFKTLRERVEKMAKQEMKNSQLDLI
jgi:DNA polymerase-1